MRKSFRVHQDTLQWAHKYNTCEGAKLYYNKIHVGHDGTTLESAPFPKEVGPAGTGTLPIDPASVTAHSPLELFEIIPWVPIREFYFSFTNPSLFMLLTLSLVLLLLFFGTKREDQTMKMSSMTKIFYYYFKRGPPSKVIASFRMDRTTRA